MRNITSRIAGIFLVSLLGLIMPACDYAPTAALTPSTETASPSATAQALHTVTIQPEPTNTLARSSSPTASPKPSFTATATTVLCSPLEDIRLEELFQPDLMKNPFQAPRPGVDDGHPGVDFSYWSRGDRTAMLGLGVQAVLAGRVAGLVQNRMPYGYAIIIETSIERLPKAWISRLGLPTPSPTVAPAPNLICPAVPPEPEPTGERSLYLLYAHLNREPDLSIGEEVVCGQAIGEVGTTGRSVNPHLHLETRIGPAGATFTELAHYDNSATEAEMRNYCTWRVSGLYQLLDPMAVIQALALQP